jgi:hypothetical protein
MDKKFPYFNVDIYRNSNPDLINFNNEQLQEHYINHGQYEYRVCSAKLENNNLNISSEEDFFKIFTNFDIEIYRNSNPDLVNFNKHQLIYHYINHGHLENRVYSDNNYSVGFIILRHVNNELTNLYWRHSYNCIRQYYKENHILIIDDNSDYRYITNENEGLYKTTIIKSEYPKRGELLPYYYYLHNKLFDCAVIIHDSVFINKPIDLHVDKYKILWDFDHDWDCTDFEREMIKLFDNQELTEFYDNKHLWKGCFGGMTIIKHDFLSLINSKYDITKLFDCIQSRHYRSCFERVLACLLQKEDKKETLLGNIHSYCRWRITFHEKDNFKHLPVIKVWTGR